MQPREGSTNLRQLASNLYNGQPLPEMDESNIDEASANMTVE